MITNTTAMIVEDHYTKIMDLLDQWFNVDMRVIINMIFATEMKVDLRLIANRTIMV
jgi:hypothetical protein